METAAQFVISWQQKSSMFDGHVALQKRRLRGCYHYETPPGGDDAKKCAVTNATVGRVETGETEMCVPSM